MTELAESTARFLGLETADLNRGAPILDFVKTAWLSIALLIVRVISERVCIPILASVIKDGPKRTVSRQVFDDSFIAFFSALLEALAVVNTVLYNGGECSDNTVSHADSMRMRMLTVCACLPCACLAEPQDGGCHPAELPKLQDDTPIMCARFRSVPFVLTYTLRMHAMVDRCLHDRVAWGPYSGHHAEVRTEGQQ